MAKNVRHKLDGPKVKKFSLTDSPKPTDVQFIKDIKERKGNPHMWEAGFTHDKWREQLTDDQSTERFSRTHVQNRPDRSHVCPSFLEDFDSTTRKRRSHSTMCCDWWFHSPVYVPVLLQQRLHPCILCAARLNGLIKQAGASFSSSYMDFDI